MKKFEQNLPESFSLFKRKFIFALDKANSSDTTIFTESVNIDKITDELILEHYTYFNKNFRQEFESVQDSGLKSKVINESITESYFQNNFNVILDKVLETGNISMGTEYLLENTVESFGLDLEKVGINYLEPENKENIKVIEENVFGTAAAAVAGTFMGLGLGASLGIGGLTALAASLFLPARETEKFNDKLSWLIGAPLGALMGTGNLWKTGKTSGMALTHDNIIKFDNIDTDPAVKKLFLKIQKIGPNVKEARSGLESLVAECVSQNKDILTMDPEQKPNIISILRSDYDPRNYNIFRIIRKSWFGSANSDHNDFGTLIRYRKCLSNKLVDIYKLLLISNLQNNKNHKRIIENISKVNNRPENILSFLPSETDEDKKLKDALLALIQFRIYLTDLAYNLEKGIFQVDIDAGKYLKQKLSVVDSEVENYLRLNNNKYKEPFEGNLMDRKPSNTKRSILSFNSNI